ncbi:methionyl-tRNA formyltransferase [Riemerella anatipestifer]|uniref:formyltransferase family protein n=1 Tax=Riemerella anatipestifer TaxID=34085 RepID=UPI001AD6F524|nr:formyltransferase family protein [Riemerella anatipestifer]MBO4233918.1 methionyl-tRNA formyltransferase [Riemerella anatipestifer]
MKKFRVFISGQKYFGEMVFRLCLKLNIEVVGVCCPLDDKYLGRAARTWGVPIIPAGTLRADVMPECDLGITAHSFDYIGKKTRYIPRLGWLGYHPSLLPRHRGRSAIEWAIRMNDAITGGTIFWLNAGIDRGDIAYQDWCFIPPEYYLNPKDGASKLWRDELCPMGIRLYEKALKDILNEVIIRKPQDKRFSTFEPSTDVKDIYRPDLLMIEHK